MLFFNILNLPMWLVRWFTKSVIPTFFDHPYNRYHFKLVLYPVENSKVVLFYYLKKIKIHMRVKTFYQIM